jgi:D-lactate dehydrogenase (cytochrome)
MAPLFDQHGIYVGYLFTSLSTNALIIEPVFYWPEARQALIEATVEAQHLSRLPVLANNLAATAVVAEARRGVIDICTRMGCGHFQIGRSYAYLAKRDEASLKLIETLKSTLDPSGALNPGGLGLNPATAGSS